MLRQFFLLMPLLMLLLLLLCYQSPICCSVISITQGVCWHGWTTE
jgi:hypothetical protein